MIRVKNIKIDALLNQDKELLKCIYKKMHINKENIDNYIIRKRSIDARDKNKILFVYEVDVEVNINYKVDNKNTFLAPDINYNIPDKKINTDTRPIIVGSGPAGLFTAYRLLLSGIKPIIIERGEDIDARIKSVNDFFQTNKLNNESNIQFGCGGAGTFSDGKLNTLTKDDKNRNFFVLNTFFKFGANEDILYDYKPHIGTDILVKVIKNMCNEITSLGGEIRYNTKLTNIITENNKITSIEVNNKEIIDTNYLILAIGNSARDTFRMLYDNKLYMESKPFAVGLRIMHDANMINESQYGPKYMSVLPTASYKLTYKSSNNHGVYTFCMCPGGYVINASSEEGMVAINGMSNNLRDSSCSNSAIIVTVNKDDFGPNPLDGLKFQENLEKKAYLLGNSYIPIQILDDYYKNIKSTSFLDLKPEFKGKYQFANLNDLLPNNLNLAIKETLLSFDKKIKGFASPSSVLAGVESRTSSPLIIKRNENFESSIEGVYPVGEGAGYAGGIMTSAIDGIKVGEKIVEKLDIY